MLKSHFRHFFAADPERLHFAAHSHHPWPDVTRDAQIRYWDDSARYADRKWDRVFGDIVPQAQRHLAGMLSLSDPAQVAFASNTHEFVQRLYSCFDQPQVRVLTTAHEFYSFRRQTRRLAEAGRVVAHEVPDAPHGTFVERFIAAEKRGGWDLIFLSHVLFDSAFAVRDIEAICDAAPPDAMVVIDGYHAFCAIPVDLTRVHRRAYYLGGGYKYAMTGEALGYLCVPPGCDARPLNTGWFAAFRSLTGPQPSQVPYEPDAMRFWGATFDPVGVYRFNAVMDLLQSTRTTAERIHAHSIALQEHFLTGLDALGLQKLGTRHLVLPRDAPRGNFLVFDVDDAAAVFEKLAGHHIAIDRRDRRLRFGFGVYHDAGDVDRLLERLPRAVG